MTAEQWTNLIAIIASVLAMFVSLGGLLIQYRRAEPQNRADEGGASLSFAQAAREAAEDVINKSKRIDDLETQLNELRTELTNANKRAYKFEDWARRLSHQVQMMGGQPVPFELKFYPPQSQDKG